VSRLRQIDKLLGVKELRRRLAEMETARARRELLECEAMLDQAIEEESRIRETCVERRQQRLREVVQKSRNPAVQNARLVNVYAITDEEIKGAAFQTELKTQQLEEAGERVKLEQQKLARFLQIEERTRKLCDRLAEMKRLEAARQS